MLRWTPALPPVARPAGPLEKHPYLATSLMLHALALGALALVHTHTATTDDGMRRVRSAADEQRVSESLQAARRQQMQNQVRELERVQRAMAGEPGPNIDETTTPLPTDVEALRQRARQIAERLQAQQLQRQADELAKLAKLTPQEALKRAQADPRNALPPPQASIAELLRDAQARQQAEQQRTAAAQDGRPAQSAHRGDRERARGGSALNPATASERRDSSAGRSTAGSDGSAGNGGRSGGGGHGQDIGRLDGDRGQSGLDRRAYGELVAAPDLNPANLRLQQGHRIGAGGPLATRVLLDRWHLVGPFDGPGAAAMAMMYPPEIAVDLQAVYEGKDRRLLQWQPLTAPPYPLVPDPRHGNAVYYAYTEVHSDRPREVWLEVGADDDSKIWLNDTLVWQSSHTQDKPWYRQPWYDLQTRLAQHNLVEGRVRVPLKAGRNTVLLKLYNGIDLAFFSVVVVP
jgi:hypothetical protein